MDSAVLDHAGDTLALGLCTVLSRLISANKLAVECPLPVPLASLQPLLYLWKPWSKGFDVFYTWAIPTVDPEVSYLNQKTNHLLEALVLKDPIGKQLDSF